MNITFSQITYGGSGSAVVFVAEDKTFFSAAKHYDKKTKGALTKALKSRRFTGKKGEFLSLMSPSGVTESCIILMGLGKISDLTESVFEELGASLAALLALSGETEVTVMVEKVTASLSVSQMAARLAHGAVLKSYRFDRYRTQDKPTQKPSLKTFTVGCENPAQAEKAYAPLKALSEGVFLTRDLTSEPPNVLYPIAMAEQCKKLARLGLDIHVFDEKQMKKWGMGALLGVAQGSVHAPRLVTLHYKGDPQAKDKRPLAFVGKGVTFDSGGISIKPAPGMEEMKFDMAGAGAVIGLMRTLALRKARVNVVGVVGLVENMPSGSAQRPGDVVTTMSGQTVEILNTDAEGRLVLADALWYAQEAFNPRLIVDLATLTGAIIVALGYDNAGLFASDDTLATQLSKAGEVTGETLWRMPLSAAYDRDINCDVADMKNLGTERVAASITAAQFIQRFIKKGTPWAHLDIAGTAWSRRDRPLSPRGATGFGVRLLDRFIADNYER